MNDTYYYRNFKELFRNNINNNQIVIAQDITIENHKRYWIKDVEKLELIDDKNYYELITEEKPVKLFFDIEFNTDENIVLPLFNEKLGEFYKKMFDEELVKPFVLYGGIKKHHNELSLHYIYNTNKYFKNNITLKCFIQEFIIYIKGIKDLKYINYKGTEKYIFDTSVYNRNQCFRLYNQSKKGTYRPLRSIPEDIEYNIHDIVICSYKEDIEIYEYTYNEFIININKNIKRYKQLSQYTTKNPETDSILFQLKHIPNKKDKSMIYIRNKDDILLNIPNKGIFYQEKSVWLFIGSLCKKIGIDLITFNKWTGDNELKSYNKFVDLIEKINVEKVLIKILSVYNDVVDIRNVKEFYEIKPDVITNEYKRYHKTYSSRRLKNVINYHSTEIMKKEENIIKTKEKDTYKPYEKRDLRNLDTILIKSGLGTGKTYQLLRSISSGEYKSCIVLTPRRTFANNIITELNDNISKNDGSNTIIQFKLYQDIKDRKSFYNCKWLVIQQESLYKLYDAENNITNTFDLVCIDEVESIQTQMTSKETNKGNIHYNLSCFKHLVKNSKLNIFCDGYLTYRSLNMCNDLGMKWEVVNNTYIDRTKTAEQIFPNKSNVELHDITSFLHTKIIKENKKMYCVITKKSLLKEIKLEPFVEAGKKVKIYHGDQKDEEKIISDVNNEWVKYDLIMTTTTITVGIDFQAEHFNYGLIYGDYQCGLVRDAFQCIFRVRKLKKIYYCINGSVKPRRKIEISTITDNIYQKVQMVKDFCYMKENGDNELDVSTFLNKGEMDIWNKNILLYNLYEKEINRLFYPFVFKYFLDINGFQNENFGYNQKTKLELTKEDIPNGTYDKLKVLTELEYNKIKNKEKNERTKQEELQYQKYKFDLLFDNVPEEIDTAFELFISKKSKSIFYKLYNEKYKTPKEILQKKHNQYYETMELDFLKLDIIENIKSTYNMKNIMDTDFSMKIKDFQENYNKLSKTIQKNIDKIYGTKTNNKPSTKIKKIFEDWSENTIDYKRKMVNGKREYYYYIKTKHIYKNIYELLKDRREKCEIK